MIHPIILSGGSGTRLWPLSREQSPKQVIPLVGRNSLLQEAVSRMDGVENVADPLVVCNEAHRFIIDEQVRAAGRGGARFILEPIGRNTAPALTLAALALGDGREEALLLVMPSDHHIRDQSAFRDAVGQAVPLARDGRLVTFGVRPESAETGYGYIRRGAGPHDVAEFIEKPDLDDARRMVDSGAYLWNSGTFLIDRAVWLEELARYRPEIVDACQKAINLATREGNFLNVDRQAFMACASDSIDYAVMERTDRAAVVPLAAGWSDVGSWSSFWEVSEHDRDGNLRSGDTFSLDSRDCVLISTSRLLSAIGLNGIALVETRDAVLAVPREMAQRVKEVVAWLDSQARDEHRAPLRASHPWGDSERIDAGAGYQVNRLTIRPGGTLTRKPDGAGGAHWVILQGQARVKCGDRVSIVAAQQSIDLIPESVHTVDNPGGSPLEIVEIRSRGPAG